MSDLKNALDAFEKLDPQEVNYLLKAMLRQEKVDIPQLISAYAEHLANFKHDAQTDIQKLAEAGLTLADKEIKSIGSIKSLSKRQLHTALAHTLLQAGYRGTVYNEKLSAKIDQSIVDKSWYEHNWQLKTVTPNQRERE